MYSPGSLKVAVVVTFPRNAVRGGASNSVFSTAGRASEKLTVPGPRNLLHTTVTAGVLGAVAPATTLASSATHNTSGTGRANSAVIDVLWPRGPCTNGPDAL